MIRLLVYDATGKLRLAEFSDGTTPPYAILSHTWSIKEEDECTKKDIEEDIWDRKPGNLKVHFSMKQASMDGLEYVWIDTCCINKESSAEQSEAINSMFKWYESAARCYVYLSDISSGQQRNFRTDNCSHGDEHHLKQRRKSEFQESRWFTRGWTLQELLAPTTVEFFSQDSISLGQKQDLLEEITHITGIPTEALRGGGRALARFSVKERWGWMLHRETKREEDVIYSLLGIVDISMAALYGEGFAKARKRMFREIKASQESAEYDRQLPNIFNGLGNNSVPSSSLNEVPPTGRHAGDEFTKPNLADESPFAIRTEVHASGSRKRGSARPQTDRAMPERGTKEHKSGNSARHQTTYENYGGTQNNNTKIGNMFCGPVTGPMNIN